MRHSNTGGHRGILLIALMIGILIGSLIIVAIIRAPINAGSLANSFGPCTYFIEKRSGQYIVTSQIAIGGLIAGQQVVSTPAQDFRAFFQPFIDNEAQLGHGTNCLDSAEYDISSSQTCTVNGAQTCGLLMKGHAIFFTCPGYARPSFGNPPSQPGISPCFIRYTGTTTISCLLCWGEYNANKEWDGGGLSYVSVDGNGVGSSFVTDCIEVMDIQDFRMYYGSSSDCLGYDIELAGAEPGGISNVKIVDNLFGAQAAISLGVGIGFNFGVGQSWIQGNFFAAVTYGYAILVNGGANGFSNQIIANHIEGCAAGTGGLDKAGTCIYDTDNYEQLQFNSFSNGVNYHCMYLTGIGDVVVGNSCIGTLNGNNNADGSCYFVFNGSGNEVLDSNSCLDIGAGNLLKFGISCSPCGTNSSMVGNDIRGKGLIRAIDFFNSNAFGDQISGVEAWNNPGYDPVGKITNFICTTCQFPVWMPQGSPNAQSSTIVASTTYKAAFINQQFTCNANAAVGGGVTVKDNLGNIVINALAITTFCSGIANNPFWLFIGWNITFGAFTGGPPLVTDYGL